MLAQQLGIPRRKGTKSFLLILLIDALGTGLFAPFSLLYFHVIAALPLTEVGVALSIATVFTFPVIPLTGTLVDRFGARRLVIGAQLLQGVGFLGYLLVRDMPLLIIMAILVNVGQRIFWSAYFSLVSELSEGGERDRWFGLLGAAQITGIGIGNALTGVLIGTLGTPGYYSVVAIDALSFFVAALMLYFLVPVERREDSTEHKNAQQGSYRMVLRDRPFLGLIVTNAAFALCFCLIGLGLPVYATDALHIPIWVVGVALGLNTALIAFLQTFLIRHLRAMRRTRILILAGLILALWSLLYILALPMPQTIIIPYIIIATCTQAFGEALHAPTSNALATEASPLALRGRYLAVFQFSWALALFVAPTMFTVSFSLNPALPWAIGTVLALLASLGTFLLEPHLPREAIHISTVAPQPEEQRQAG
ncbi:MFS transporter [Dictyobacter aurantiacus]|uniref:MFS transporter n=1 Tax=Dictyobacter aurantiacus TaxID=1936993 RepID=A0A401ZJI8_9CHLR|nr:MFS transporter [Dictyobacter aurantiacus]GCE07002.1 MFS transporter [Dictyobacter aurantiacus]